MKCFVVKGVKKLMEGTVCTVNTKFDDKRNRELALLINHQEKQQGDQMMYKSIMVRV